MKTFYTYVYRDPRTSEPFYVGKGFGKRCFTHLGRKDRHPLASKIKSLKRLGFTPHIEIREASSEDEALLREKQLIAEYGRKDLGLGPLLNLTDGGDGRSGYLMPEEQKRKIAEGNRGKIVTIETRLKQSLFQKNKTLSQTAKDRLGASVTGAKNGNAKILTLRSPAGDVLTQPSHLTAAEFCASLGLRYPSLHKAFCEGRSMKGWDLLQVLKKTTC